MAVAFALGVPLVALVGSTGGSTVLLMLATFGAGCAVIGGQTNLHAAAGRFYPTFIRANGIGWANGVGRRRRRSILGPVIGGVLIGLDLRRRRNCCSVRGGAAALRRHRLFCAGAAAVA